MKRSSENRKIFNFAKISSWTYLGSGKEFEMEGFYKKCGRPVGRYVEKGEDPKYSEIIAKIREELKN